MKKNTFTEAKRAALERYFSRMNDRQREAVFTVNGPLLVLAGAGSGKTTVIVNRIANMINFGNAYYDESREGNPMDETFLRAYADGKEDDADMLRGIVAVEPVKPWNILAITFTNKAAGELKERLSAMLGEDALNIHASTFHSACVRILRSEIGALGYGTNFTIYDSDDSQRMIKNVMAELDISEKQLAPKAVLAEISSAKDKMITPEELREEAGMDPEAENETIQATLTYMGGLYVNGNPDNDMELAIFRDEDGNVIYVIYELGTLNYGFYTTEDATTEDGRTYEKVLVDEKTTYGYYFNEDLESGILIGTDGTVYDALALDESVARDLVKTTITGQ